MTYTFFGSGDSSLYILPRSKILNPSYALLGYYYFGGVILVRKASIKEIVPVFPETAS
jgi:hypothetical protein